MRQNNRRARRKRPRWELRLYVADTSPRSVLAAGNLRKICAQHLADSRITIIDIVSHPAMARVHNILATPTLVLVGHRKDTTIVGTLADTQKVLQALGVSPDNAAAVPGYAPPFPQIGHA
jgi:circadian clock protein KaiB